MLKYFRTSNKGKYLSKTKQVNTKSDAPKSYTWLGNNCNQAFVIICNESFTEEGSN